MMKQIFKNKVVTIGASQMVIVNEKTSTFQSYDSIIAQWDNNKKTLTLNQSYWDYSSTTRKYFKQFINDFTGLSYDSKALFLKEIETNKSIKVVK